MKMKKIIILLFFAFILTLSLSAYEHVWGTRLDLNVSAPDINGTTATLSSLDSFTLWYEGSFSPALKLRLDGALGFNFATTFAVDVHKDLQYVNTAGDLYPDIKTVQVFGSYGIFDYRLGRHLYTDPSRMIFSQALDGLDLGIRLGPGTLRVEAGYTGLIHFLASSQSMTKNDVTDRSDTFFGSPRLIETLSYKYPELWQEHLSLVASFTAQQDLQNDLVAGTEKLHTYYLHLGVNGFLIPSLGYEANAVYQRGFYGENSATGFLGSAKFLWFTGWGNSFVTLKGVFSSGDKWKDRQDYFGAGVTGETNQFTPITSCGSVGYVENFSLGNISAGELLINLSKTRRFAAQISTTSILRNVNGPVSSSLVINNGKDSAFLGQEVLLNILGRPSQNFGIGFKAGVLAYGEAITINTLLEDYLPVLFKAGIDLSFSF